MKTTLIAGILFLSVHLSDARYPPIITLLTGYGCSRLHLGSANDSCMSKAFVYPSDFARKLMHRITYVSVPVKILELIYKI